MTEEEKKQIARDRAKKYYQENKEKVLARQREYARKKYHESEEYRKKNYERCKKYREKNRPKFAMSQRRYMAKKRDLGEFPKTKNQIIEELQSNWNELKNGLQSLFDFEKGVVSEEYLECAKDTLDKMKELEGNNE